jgi:hypothetical protein
MFLLGLGIRQECSLSSSLFKYMLEVLDITIKKAGSNNEKEGYMSLFADNMTIYTEYHKQ